MNAQSLVQLGNKLFNDRKSLLSLWQEIAFNFYPERADFTGQRSLGQDYAAHLMDSFPQLARRELGNTISTMLRQRGSQWFELTTGRPQLDEKPEVAKWLEDNSAAMRRAMYDPRSRFVRATKEGDHDYVTFGQCVISVEESPARDHLLYRSWHLRDCAWLENEVGQIDHLHRNMKMQARNMIARWGNKVDARIRKIAETAPGQKFDVRHVALPKADYDAKFSAPFVSIYIDVEKETIIDQEPLPNFRYCVPRWQTISGWQYALSPAVIIALPDARLMQEMGRVLLEAGEKGVSPPLVATEEAVKSDVDIRAGGITWVDAEYDERMGQAIRQLEIRSDMNAGITLRQDIRQMMTKAFFLDRLAIPDLSREMTAYETSKRVEDFVRNALPLFEPMETEYNGQLLQRTYEILSGTAAISMEEMPQELQGMRLDFMFNSPIQSAEGRAKVAQYQECAQLIGIGQQEGTTVNPIDGNAALRGACEGTGAPAEWFKTDEQMAQEQQQKEQQVVGGNIAQSLQQGAGVAGQVADATQKMREAGLVQ